MSDNSRSGGRALDAIFDSPIEPSHKFILVAIGSALDYRGDFLEWKQISVAWFIKKTGYSKPTIIDALKKIEELGYLESRTEGIKIGRGDIKFYRLTERLFDDYAIRLKTPKPQRQSDTKKGQVALPLLPEKGQVALPLLPEKGKVALPHIPNSIPNLIPRPKNKPRIMCVDSTKARARDYDLIGITHTLDGIIKSRGRVKPEDKRSSIPLTPGLPMIDWDQVTDSVINAHFTNEFPAKTFLRKNGMRDDMRRLMTRYGIDRVREICVKIHGDCPGSHRLLFNLPAIEKAILDEDAATDAQNHSPEVQFGDW